MPIYNYECRSCGDHFTTMMPIQGAEQRKVRCPKCDSEDTEQRIEAAFVATGKKS